MAESLAHGTVVSLDITNTTVPLTDLINQACFSVATGDVEDAPALDPLHKFKVVEKDGAVYIEAKKEDVKNGRRNLSIKCKPKEQEHVLVIGGYVVKFHIFKEHAYKL